MGCSEVWTADGWGGEYQSSEVVGKGIMSYRLAMWNESMSEELLERVSGRILRNSDTKINHSEKHGSGYSTFIQLLLCMLASLAPPAKTQRAVWMYVLNTDNSAGNTNTNDIYTSSPSLHISLPQVKSINPTFISSLHSIFLSQDLLSPFTPNHPDE
ncbi:hypothetical protein N431DRAFT_161450 [Stipitochalara longipes BDJ]|nr:hypothetical protein N431DRAFT_161450 [Stipitochalara longipes BDJ]